MNEHLHDDLIDQLRKLRETGEALLERVEDVAASIRYMTNNLLDDQYHPKIASNVRELARQVNGLTSLSPSARVDEALPRFTQQVEELANQCHEAVECGATEQEEMAQPSDAENREAVLPSSVQRHLAEILSMLHEDAKQLAGCERLGEETAWQWWENRLVAVQQAFGELDQLQAQASSIGADLSAPIERLGGVPITLLADQWPEDLVEAYAEEEDEDKAPESEAAGNGSEGGRAAIDRGQRQQTLFSSFAAEPENGAIACAASPAEQVEAPRDSQGQRGMDSLDPHRPYTLDNYRAFCERRSEEELSADDWKAEYAWLRAERCGFLDHLQRNHNAKQLKELAMRSGYLSASRQTKTENAATIYRACLQGFVLGNSIQYNPMSEKIEDAIDRIVANLTVADFVKHRELRKQRQHEHKKAITNPETLLEFHTFVRELGEHLLNDEQHLRRDQLYANLSRQTRAERQSNSVEQFQSPTLEGLEFSIKEGYHDKRECPLWIVQLSTRVDRQAYGELKRKALQLGGRYSSFKKDQAGFYFFARDAAEKFSGLKEGDADRSDELEDRRIRKLENTGQRFSAMAQRMTEDAEATLAADDERLKNTTRRAEQAASTRAHARSSLATAKTLQSLASQLSSGEATYLDGVRYAVQIETLHAILKRARWAHFRHVMQEEYGNLSSYEKNHKQDELEQRPADASDIRYAEYPKPYLYRGHLQRAFAQLRTTQGVKQVTAKMQKLVDRTPQEQEYVEFNHESDVELLEDFLSRAKAAGYNCYWFDHCLEQYQRLRRANIHDAHELRAALAELLPHLAPPDGEDSITLATDELRGKELPGFYPTPRPIIHQMLDLADIQGDDRVLEPSAGMGDILDAIRQRHPDVDLKAIERNHTLADVLAAKGYDELTTFGDFLEHQGPYDRIVMNPPFEEG